MTDTITLQDEVRALVKRADFVAAWPTEVKQTLARALQTADELPAYAVKEVRWAMKQARNIESKCERDILEGQRTLSHADRRRLVAV